MTSVQTRFAQRNSNNNQLIPVRYPNDLSFFNITNAAIYTLNITNAQYTGGMFYVDITENDADGNPLNLDGTFAALAGSPPPEIPIIIFAVNIDIDPAVYPGFEIPLFFRNLPNLTTIGIISASSLTGDTVPLPFIVSPPFPGRIVGTNISQNIRFKSDGENFDVVSSGPAGWFGVPALATILTAFLGIP